MKKDPLLMLMIAGAIIGATVSLFLMNDLTDTSGKVVCFVGGGVCGIGGGIVLYTILGRLRARGFFAPYL